MNTPLVFLPGMMCDGRLFGPQVEVLSVIRSVSCGELVAADRIGALAEDALSRAPDLFALAGLSMGGIVAMEVLRRAPERVAGLALMDTNPLAELPDVAARRGPQMERARTGGLYSVMQDEMKPNYLAKGDRRGEVLDLCMEMAMDLGPNVFCRQSIALRDRPDQTAVLAESRVPTLVLCGREDALCPVSRHEFMHELIPGSTFTIIEGAGHLPTLEKPQETTAALARWLKDVDNE